MCGTLRRRADEQVRVSLRLVVLASFHDVSTTSSGSGGEALFTTIAEGTGRCDGAHYPLVLDPQLPYETTRRFSHHRYEEAYDEEEGGFSVAQGQWWLAINSSLGGETSVTWIGLDAERVWKEHEIVGLNVPHRVAQVEGCYAILSLRMGSKVCCAMIPFSNRRRAHHEIILTHP